MSNKYKIFIQYSSVFYERLIINIFRYISDIETKFVGDMYISAHDEGYIKANDNERIVLSTHSNGEPFKRNELDFFLKYMKNLYNELNAMVTNGSTSFTEIEIIEIKED